MGETTRIAPSPTGLLHLGHAFAACFAAEAAGEGGRFLVRIEDIDPGRCRPEFETAIFADLAWLGLRWELPVRRQSEHLDAYCAQLAMLEGMGLLYPCFCTRGDIAREVAGAAHAPHGPDGILYPGTCRGLAEAARVEGMASGRPYALRLDMAAAIGAVGKLGWHDRAIGRVEARPERFGDVVLGRKDIPTSYHLAATLDDHLQGVSLVTRGSDLFEATHVHRLLQALLGLDSPEYHHHPLRLDANGRRFAKRDRGLTLAALREAGHTPEAVRAMAGVEGRPIRATMISGT